MKERYLSLVNAEPIALLRASIHLLTEIVCFYHGPIFPRAYNARGSIFFRRPALSMCVEFPNGPWGRDDTVCVICFYNRVRNGGGIAFLAGGE